MSSRSRRRPYVESPVIMSTVRIIAPFVLTFGLFVTLHGASSPGGGFQGGVIVASVVVMLSFAYGIDRTWEWLHKPALVAVTVGGLALFGLVALGTVFLGHDFFELAEYPIADASKYGIELVEVGIAMIVTGVITLLFFMLARGAMPPASETSATGPERTGTVGATDADPSDAETATDGGPMTTESTAGGSTGGADGGERA